jgi:hypothetical protein
MAMLQANTNGDWSAYPASGNYTSQLCSNHKQLALNSQMLSEFAKVTTG